MQVCLALLVVLGSWSCTAVALPEHRTEHAVRSADGVSIAYEEHGTKSPALVFVHGWCGERGLWRTTLEALAPAQRVLALDLAGHGTSGSERAHWTLDSLADDVVAVVLDAGAEDVILVGHSMGAPVALLAAARLAPRVRGVIAVESLHDVRFRYSAGFLEEVAAGLESDFSRALEASLRGVVAPDMSPELFAWLRSRAVRTEPAAAIGLLRGLEGFDLARALGQAQVPVRVINAAPRPGSAFDGTQAAALAANRGAADFDALEMAEAGHYPMLEHSARFRALLGRWVEELSAAPRHPPREP